MWRKDDSKTNHKSKTHWGCVFSFCRFVQFCSDDTKVDTWQFKLFVKGKDSTNCDRPAFVNRRLLVCLTQASMIFEGKLFMLAVFTRLLSLHTCDLYTLATFTHLRPLHTCDLYTLATF